MASDLIKLTDKQEMFCRAFVKSLSATDAYRTAYDTSAMKASIVKVKAAELLQHEKVAARIEQLQSAVREVAEKKFNITIERILAEWANIAFADPGDYFDWGVRTVTRYRKDGEAYTVQEQYVTLKPKDQLTEAQRRAVAAAEMTISRTGDTVASVKIHDKAKALVELGKHIGFYEVDHAQKGAAALGYLLAEDDGV